MVSFDHRLKEVHQYFENGDTHLGYRRLLDAALETSDQQVFQATLQFSDWFEKREQIPDDGSLPTRVGNLLQLMERSYQVPATLPPPVQMEARGISKKYARGAFSLSPVDITLHPAHIIGLVGENGNGKTTLLRVLFGELKADAGTVKYAFGNNHPNDFYETRSRMAFIPQRPAAWNGSLMDNLQFATVYTGLHGEANRLWTEMIIARMGLRPFRDHTWSRISSGYKMRFELARTILRQPQLLLLDEPLANLDMLAQQIILEDLRYLAQSERRPLSIILSSQQLYEVEKVSDQVIFLQKGVARYQHSEKEASAAALVVELETEASRETLQSLLLPLQLERLSYNGGVYLLYFHPSTSLPQLLETLGNAKMPLRYLRDISSSSRRFFDA